MDEKIYVILKVLLDFALDVWFSIFILMSDTSLFSIGTCFFISNVFILSLYEYTK